MPVFKVQFHRGGVFLPRIGLWLDAHEPQRANPVFVSHAHSDHTELHREIIVSGPTAELMRARLEGQWNEHVLPFGEKRPFFFGEVPFEITLLPAGHIFGSAMSLIHAGDSSLLYTGDFKLRPGLSAEKCEPAHADVLIMETTYGRPQYRFPPTHDVIQGVVRFCREALDNDETPVLLGYSLGKSQELLCGLGDAGLPIMLHGTVHKLTKIYERFGKCFPPYEKYSAENARNKVLLCPPSVAGSAMLRNVGRTRLAVLTGWAVDPNCRFRYQAHAAFPLSDHADFSDLLEFVKRVNPKKVYTLHGFAAEFAQSLRDLGFDAQPLSEEDQLALPLIVPPRHRSAEPKPAAGSNTVGTSGSAAGIPPVDSFFQFAEVCAAIAGTTKKLEKTALLAAYLKGLDSRALSCAAVWFTGNPFPSSQNKKLQLGWALIRDALCRRAELDQSDFGQIYLKHSDLGEAGFEILERLPRDASEFVSISETDRVFEQLLTARGPTGKLPVLLQALARCGPLEAKYLIKILTGDLRIGLKEGLVEEAIAKAFHAQLDDVKRVNLLLGNIGETAVLALHQQLPSATLLPFRAVKYMLASPEETAADIWERALEWNGAASEPAPLPNLELPAPSVEVWLEDKYDGIRAQVHKVGQTVAIFSRDLKEITASFEELADAARALPHDFICDGEIIAMRGEAILPYAELQKRLGRREADLFMREEIPVQFIAFDLLWRNGENLLNEPLARRRALLEETINGAFRAAQITSARSADDIERAFNEARARKNEGLIIKDPRSIYSPGRRGLAWLKLKKAYATLDCIVVGAEYGHGKRRAVLSDYTFAVRDENSGELKTIGKAYTGLTDAEIAKLTEHFLKRVVWQHGRYFAVEPDTVLEIAFDLLQRSPRHTSGLAMRFPRIVRIRTDKSLAEIDTLGTARKIAGLNNTSVEA